MPQHFVAPPQWEWYIVWYFFLGGLAGGAYLIGTLLRLLGDARDQRVARLAFLVAFLAMVICPILLTLDLGHPARFWHMLVNSRTGALNFKYWSPMSVGAWALLGFGFFATLSFIEALVQEGRLRHGLARGIADVMGGVLGRLFMVLGALFGLFVAGYTGVLLSVSNQPVWSDTWALGGLFLASGLSVGAATLAIVARARAEKPPHDIIAMSSSRAQGERYARYSPGSMVRRGIASRASSTVAASSLSSNARLSQSKPA